MLRIDTWSIVPTGAEVYNIARVQSMNVNFNSVIIPDNNQRLSFLAVRPVLFYRGQGLHL